MPKRWFQNTPASSVACAFAGLLVCSVNKYRASAGSPARLWGHWFQPTGALSYRCTQTAGDSGLQGALGCWGRLGVAIAGLLSGCVFHEYYK